METTSIRLPIRNLPKHFDRSRITVVLEEIEMALIRFFKAIVPPAEIRPVTRRVEPTLIPTKDPAEERLGGSETSRHEQDEGEW